MARYRSTDYHLKISEAIRSVLAEYSLNLVRADEVDFYPQIWDNIEACMDACHYGIVVFEQVDERDINPNVTLELGYMRGQRKLCLLLKEQRLPKLQTDLSGYLFSEFDIFRIETTVEEQVRRWLRNIGIAKRSGEKVLVFVSAGGTCRCAMAKAITEHILVTRPTKQPIRVVAAAVLQPYLSGASNGAQRAIEDMFGSNLLASHRAVQLTQTLVREADLVLLMDHGLYGVLQKAGPSHATASDWPKIHVLKPYFGVEGDIADPWKFKESGEEACEYSKTALELRSIIEPNVEKLIQQLHQRD